MIQPEESLLIELGPQERAAGLSLDAFSKVINATRSMLRELDATKSADWQIDRLSMNSPGLVGIIGIAVSSFVPVDKGVIDNYLGVVEALSYNKPMPRVKPSVLRKGRVIMNALNSGLGHMKLSSPGRETVIPVSKPRIETLAIQQSATAGEYYDWTELVGNLQLVSSATGTWAIGIVDSLSKHRTECDVSEEQLLKALDAMQRTVGHSPRIAVFGRTLYRNDKPEQMKVDRFDVLPDGGDSNVLFAVQGIDITGGMDSVAYVRSLRDA